MDFGSRSALKRRVYKAQHWFLTHFNLLSLTHFNLHLLIAKAQAKAEFWFPEMNP